MTAAVLHASVKATSTVTGTRRQQVGRLMLALLLAAVTGGCGGGGGGGGSGGSSTEPALIFSSNRLSGQVVARTEPSFFQFPFRIGGSVPDGSLLVIALADSEGVVADARVSSSGRGGLIDLFLRPLNGAGQRLLNLQVLACRNERCSEQYPGSPVALTIAMSVLPNIELPAEIRLSRSGNAAPPSTSVPIAIPPAAGSVFMGPSAPTPLQPVDFRFDGSALHVTGRVVRSGTYDVRVGFASASDTRYVTETVIRYEVLPPPGGEFDWRLIGSTSFALPEGGSATRRVTVVPPTWIAEPVALDTTLLLEPWLTMQPAGPGSWDLTVNASGLPPGRRSVAPLRFVAEPFAAAFATPVEVDVAPVFEIFGTASVLADRNSTLENLQFDLQAALVDGSTEPAVWRLEGPSGWFRPQSLTGRVGLDPIRFALDPAALRLNQFGSRESQPPSSVEVTISIDRPGTSPRTRQLSFSSVLSTLHYALPTRLSPGAGRIYLIGSFQRFDVLPPHRFSVAGARLVDLRSLEDFRMPGTGRAVVVLDVDGLVAGQPVTVTMDAGLNTRSLTIPVADPPASVEAMVGLPSADRRAPAYSPSLDALFWAEPGRVRVARRSTGGWSMEALDMPGLIDLDLSVDGTVIYAATTEAQVDIDARTLQLKRQVRWSTQSDLETTVALEAGGLETSLAVTIEDLVWTATRTRDSFGNISRPIARWAPVGPVQNILFGPALDRIVSDAAQPTMTLLRSADHTAVASYLPSSGFAAGTNIRGHDFIGATPFDLVAATPPAAMSSSGQRVLLSDGTVIDRSGGRASLAGLLQANLVARGYGLSTDGTTAFVYASRTVIGLGYSEADATLLAFDLGPAGALPVPRLQGSRAMPGALNCASAAQSAAECEARIRLVTDPEGREVFISGRQGFAVVPRSSIPTTSGAPVRIQRFGARVAQ